ncbi:MAG: hypothetical protein QXY10_01680 [Candidatus Micrarchaeaceae archaeon]
MAMETPIIPSQKVDVHIEGEKSTSKQNEEIYPQMPPHFIPKEGYELIGTLVKVDPTLAKYLFKLLKGAELVPDENSPTGYHEQKLNGVEAFCNNDGVDKISDLLLLHINTPLSYKEKGQSPSQIAGQIAKQFIKDTAANFEHWEIKNPSLIPQIAAVVFQFIKAAQGQNTELPEGLLAGGALRPKINEPILPKQPKGRLSI